MATACRAADGPQPRPIVGSWHWPSWATTVPPCRDDRAPAGCSPWGERSPSARSPWCAPSAGCRSTRRTARRAWPDPSARASTRASTDANTRASSRRLVQDGGSGSSARRWRRAAPRPGAPTRGPPAISGTGRRSFRRESPSGCGWWTLTTPSQDATWSRAASTHNLDTGTYHVDLEAGTPRRTTARREDGYMVRFTNRSDRRRSGSTASGDAGRHAGRAALGARRPASDGCIRQWITDAHALWDFAPDGTTVVVRA